MARKRFGQHFLHEQGIVRQIVSAIGPGPGEHIVEIGPGRGALTQPLLDAAGRLTVIEIDRDLIADLRHRELPGLDIIEGDALKIDYAALVAPDAPPLRLVGNLPYNISSPLLFALLASDAPITDMHFMLQKEVVDRMVAAPGSADYGRLSVAIAARADAVRLFDVAPGAFSPPPQVVSAVVRLLPRAPAFAIDNPTVFDQVVTAAFSKRRKTLRNALGGWLTDDDIAAAGVDARLRPERISPGEFARLANTAAARL